MFSTEQLDYLYKHFDNRYTKMFVQIDSCNDKQNKINNKFANDDKRIDIISHDFAVIKKLMWAVATASIGSLVAAFLELVLQ